MFYALVFLLGILIGILYMYFVGQERPIGVIYFYENEDGADPSMVAELFEGPADISKHEYAVFKISRR